MVKLGNSENGKSLVIIFDGTSSMHDDLVQLREAAEEIISNLSAQVENNIENYILVVFRDPDIEQPLITSNSSQIIDKLNKIELIGNQDCPEMSLSGLLVGLNLTKPKSCVFVFTDADAKDFKRLNEVIDIVKAKKIVINFLLSHTCKESYPNQSFLNDGAEVYHKLSEISHGQVFSMSRDSIKSVMTSISNQLHTNYVEILSFNGDSTKSQVDKFFVDKTIRKIFVSISGKSPSVELVNPHNEIVQMSNVLRLPNVLTGEIEQPDVGKWNIITKANSPYTVKIGGDSDTKFEVRFGDNEDTEPIADEDNKLTILVDNPSNIGNLSKVLIITKNPDGSSFTNEFSLSKINDSVYQSDAVELPNGSFDVFASGVDGSGGKFERFAGSAVGEGGSVDGAQSNDEAETQEQKSHEIIEGSDLTLECNTKDSNRVNKSWKLNGKILNDAINDENTNNYKYQIKNATQKNTGVYECTIANADEQIIKKIQVKVVKPPYIEAVTNLNEAKDGMNVTLKCNYQSDKNVEIKWIDENGNLLQDNGQYFTFKLPKNSTTIHCQVSTDDFTVNTSVELNSTPTSDSLECDNNLTTCVAKSNLDNLPNPDKIDKFTINSMPVENFPRNLKEIYPNLKSIEIINASLKAIDQSDLQPYGDDIEQLILSGNEIQTLDKDVFKSNRNLRSIDLSDNFISYIDGGVFDDLMKIEHISLRNNGCIDMEANDEIEMRILLKEIKGDCYRNYMILKTYEIVEKNQNCCNCERDKSIENNVY